MSKSQSVTPMQRNALAAAEICERVQQKCIDSQQFEFPGPRSVIRFRASIGLVRACVLASAFLLFMALVVKWLKPESVSFITTTDGHVEELSPSRVEHE